MSCPTIVHETVCVQANVRITPQVDVGTVRTFCVGDPVIGSCPGTLVRFCEFPVSQSICVQVPLTFNASAVATPAGMACGEQGVGVCSQSTECTFTIGFYRNSPEITNSIIEAAGGTIILGFDDDGLSIPVTTLNANAVLSLNPPPPAPDSPPFANQYAVLYAQLLAAKLNVLSGATCPFATAAIAAADTFLANSPDGGMAGAPDVQEPLATYNEGTAEGCPAHCT